MLAIVFTDCKHKSTVDTFQNPAAYTTRRHKHHVRKSDAGKILPGKLAGIPTEGVHFVVEMFQGFISCFPH
jgi:hypothetical protein